MQTSTTRFIPNFTQLCWKRTIFIFKHCNLHYFDDFPHLVMDKTIWWQQHIFYWCFWWHLDCLPSTRVCLGCYILYACRENSEMETCSFYCITRDKIFLIYKIFVFIYKKFSEVYSIEYIKILSLVHQHTSTMYILNLEQSNWNTPSQWLHLQNHK